MSAPALDYHEGLGVKAVRTEWQVEVWERAVWNVSLPYTDDFTEASQRYHEEVEGGLLVRLIDRSTRTEVGLEYHTGDDNRVSPVEHSRRKVAGDRPL